MVRPEKVGELGKVELARSACAGRYGRDTMLSALPASHEKADKLILCASGCVKALSRAKRRSARDAILFRISLFPFSSL